MTDEPLELSVVVPCFNVGATLSEELDALTSQVWDGSWEVVVVDNNSTDDTAAVAGRYADRGVRVVAATGGRGVAYARNSGVRSTTARSVAFCDGDDVVSPGWVEAMGNALRDGPFVGGVLDVTSLNPGGLGDARPMGSADRLPKFGDVTFASGGNLGIHREVFERLGGFDEQFRGLEDIEFSLRARAIGVIPVVVPEAVLAYRYRGGLRELWHQGFFYGRGRPALIRRCEELDLPGPSRWAGAKSWVWLVVHLPEVVRRTGRYRLLWVLANRLGVARGAWVERGLYF